ncbi:four helix bundle protein [Bergeyella zoohelcum]|nr:four helix bundle protein [Bergeyella zoohelcum]
MKVYQESMILARDIYTLTQNFPKEEVFGLTSQIFYPRKQ